MDDTKPQEPGAAAGLTEKEPAAGDIKEHEASDMLFFNVMPKEKTQGNMVDAQIKVQASAAQAAKADKPKLGELLKKYKLYLILAAVIIIGGPLIYFLISKIGAGSYKQENLLVKRPGSAATSTKPSTSPNPAASAADFTTPETWRDKYFPNCTDPTICGDDADPDHDGLSNLQEYKLGTDPNNPDSDQDGISDGDEANVFGSNPLSSHTSNNPKFSDADYIKGGYNFTNAKKLSPQEINAITAKMQSFGLHEPTLDTLGTILNTLYNFSAPDASSTPASSSSTTPSSGQNASSTLSGNLDESLSAKQSRDTERSNTIQKVEIALVSYYNDNKSYPIGPDFTGMYNEIKPYLKVATDPNDPINQDPYVYSYEPNASSSDFTLTFYSEVAAAPISKHAADAIKDAGNEQADIYDNQRENDLEDLRTALLLYSNANIAGTQEYVFPTKAKFDTALVPTYISAIPKDPISGQDYDYEPSATFDAFTLKATLQDPPPGNTGYICNQVEDCTYY
jgi:hypothetical protein